MNYTYILECMDGTYYTGWTNNLEKRLKDHNDGKGAKYTKARLPVSLIYYEEFQTKEEAMRREYAIKHMTRNEKKQLISEYRKQSRSKFEVVGDNKMEIIAYEMRFQKDIIEQSNISCVSFEEKYFSTYMHIYNECFYEMRKTLNIEPYNFLNNYEQIKEKSKDIYLLVENEEIIGSIACYGNEIDDLIVNKKFQHKGYGKQLLLWGMQCIRKKNTEPIVLHVAEWNKNALLLYK